MGPEPGAKKTEPAANVAKLLRHGQKDAYVVSSSDAIGTDKAAHDRQQPPHVQAKNTYVEYLDEVGGRRFLVTMEEPTVTKPQPIVFEISGGGGKLALTRSGTVAIVSSPAPRAG